MSEANKKADKVTEVEKAVSNAIKESIKKATIKRLSLKVTTKDFSETLEITRTLFKDKISKTSIVESSLACASAQSDSFTCTQIASFIIKNLTVNDCFHKRENNKANDVLKSTILRVRHHVVDTLKTHHKADKLYAYNKATDSVSFSDKYRKVCIEDKLYRKRVQALLNRVKAQYKVTVKKADKTTTAAAKKSA